MAKPSTRGLHTLRNLIAEADLILSTTTLPEGRTPRCREMLRAALALTEDFISQAKLTPAAVLGHKGGSGGSRQLDRARKREQPWYNAADDSHKDDNYGKYEIVISFVHNRASGDDKRRP